MKTRNQNKSNIESDRIMEKKTNITEKALSAPIYGGNNN